MIEGWLQQISGWFRVNETEMATLLKQIQAELPTTEAILVGKPQAGKSSIVRGLTGVSAEIIGQGFRPHTLHTQRYNYPTDELPLLIFTDTVGLGDGCQETADVIQELSGALTRDASEQSSHLNNPKVLILTVKITDFATATLQQIAQKIRQQHPEVPCLLVVTCLHELYRSDIAEHPPYPLAGDNSTVLGEPSLQPSPFEPIQRAFAEIQRNFSGLYDRAILIDFTLESDGLSPLFYGLEALVDGLAALLPEAEARTIAQLLEKQDTGQRISNLYREAGRRYILPFAVMAGTVAAVPLPLATMPVLTALQVSMVGALGKLYGQVLSPSQAGGVVSTIAGGFVAQAIGRELVKFIPGFGSVIAASWASAYTWALGEAACVYFGDLMGGKKPDPKRIQSAMRDSFTAAQQRFKPLKS